MKESRLWNLWERIDLANVAAKTASQLRIASQGKQPHDLDVLGKSVKFLESARKGGQFLADTQGHATFAESLDSLGLAVDAYGSVEPIMPGTHGEYDAVSHYLIDIERCINEILTDPKKPVQPRNAAKALAFFEALAQAIGSSIDHELSPHR